MVKGLVSIVIPSRKERFLKKTIQDLLAKAHDSIEIIAVLDGYWPEKEEIVEDPIVSYIHRGWPRGMRSGINSGVAVSKGEYIMKLDGHCMLDTGFDVKLKTDCKDKWVVIPRRKRLDVEKWDIQDVGKPDIDYNYLSFPNDPADFGGAGLNGRIWTEKIIKRRDIPKYEIDDEMSFQGSCWFMKRKTFDWLELMDEETYGTFWNEAQEIGLKTWLSGGRVVRNKKTWYAHLHKGKKYGRGYNLDEKQLRKGATAVNRWMVDYKWHKQIHPFEWLIEKFMPVPTWPEDRDLWKPKVRKS
jgi:glycosyltransferase involved in cell wall biosynthesis|tara:strand:- start:3375 stop:4271 length:897 start_codon:yes stop_codon:yes gene_type:complete